MSNLTKVENALRRVYSISQIESVALATQVLPFDCEWLEGLELSFIPLSVCMHPRRGHVGCLMQVSFHSFLKGILPTESHRVNS